MMVIWRVRVPRENSSSSEVESSNGSSHCEGDLLMVKRLMSAQVNEDSNSQRENVFYSRCHVKGKLYSLIINCGSSVNVASLRLVEKLSLPTLVHPRPYKFQWLSAKDEMVVDRQMSLAFTLGKYIDDILCDVVPMEATHILLGDPQTFFSKRGE
ncbi:hypothetical protein CR513_12223, partial [Mucuna pruriens]